MSKPELLNKLLYNPLNFDEIDFNSLLKSYEIKNGFSDTRELVRRIYDLNESQLKETSNANSGRIGRLNRYSNKIRQKRYKKRIESQKPNREYIRIYAEGDSWFLFPLFVTDIIDWLAKNKNYLIYSDAYGGDWLTNIIYEEQYIESLSIQEPDIFLISGGGNDLVGNNRMAVMVSRQPNQAKKYNSQNPLSDENLTDEEKELILLAQPYINKDFYSFVLTMKLQYTLLLSNLYSDNSKHKNMVSITQGYAFPYPKKGNNFSLNYPLQPLVNSFTDSGQWLFRPLMIKGILDKKFQRAIVMAFIYEFNEMLISLANNSKFKNLYHIDCRKIPKNSKDWYDELHLKSHVFKRVSRLYEKVINNKGQNLPKVIKEIKQK